MHGFLNIRVKPRSLFISVVTSLLLTLFSAPTLWAIARGYDTDDTELRPGMTVSLSPATDAQNPKVERASRERIELVIGVATTIDDSLVTVSSGSKAAYVENEGEVSAFVTDTAGDIGKGDLLTVSPIRGILTKASPGQPVVASSLDDFLAEQAETYSIQDENGERSVRVQQVRINLDRQAAASLTPDDESALTEVGKSIIGKEVEELQVIIALIIFFIVLVAEGTILYGAISSAINSLGRNPLAKNIIRQELIRVIFIAIAVLVIGVAAIYAVLWV